jgi:hypothetical protein
MFQRGINISPPTLKMCDIIKKTGSLATMKCLYTDFERLTNEGTQMLSSLTEFAKIGLFPKSWATNQI